VDPAPQAANELPSGCPLAERTCASGGESDCSSSLRNPRRAKMDASAGATRIRGTAGVCLTTRRLEITRALVLAYRRTVGALDDRLPPGADSLRHAAWAGLQDSVPRAALLSIHARVSGTEPSAWEDSSLVQLWGPRFSVYVVAAGDRGVGLIQAFDLHG